MRQGRISTLLPALGCLAVLATGAAACTRAAASASASSPGGCPPGAAASPSGCTCRADLALLLGACVPPRIAKGHCGATRTSIDGVCAPRSPCERGRARELGSGACLPRREVRAIANGLGILAGDDDILVCPDDGELAAAGVDGRGGPPRLGCLPRPSAAPQRACAAGSVMIPGGSCVRVFEGERSARAARVDVVQWLRATIGADGGEGAPPLCEAVRRSAGSLAASAGEARVIVSLAFPDNDVSSVVADIQGPDSAATVELTALIQPLIEALRSFGGTARQASVSAAVRCGRGTSGGAPRDGSGRPRPENDHEKGASGARLGPLRAGP